jgi:hypothetical protein
VVHQAHGNRRCNEKANVAQAGKNAKFVRPFYQGKRMKFIVFVVEPPGRFGYCPVGGGCLSGLRGRFGSIGCIVSGCIACAFYIASF